MGAEGTPEDGGRIWLSCDLDAPEMLTLPCGQVAAYTRGHEPGDNQDALAVASFPGGRAVLVVADGAGGQAAGAQASARAVGKLLAEVCGAVARGEPLSAAILAGFDAANRAIQELSVGAASTLVVAEIEGAVARSYHAGDSAALVTGQRGRIKHQSIAHSPVGYAQEAGVISEREALHHEERHVVSNMLGTVEMRIEVGPVVRLAARDTLVLGTDGLFDNLSVEEVVDCVRTSPLARATEKLVERTLGRMTDPAANAPSKPDDLGCLVYRPRSDQER